MIRVSFDPLYNLNLIVLESVHDLVSIAVDLELDYPAASIKTGDLVYLAILICVTLNDIFSCPHRSGPQWNGYSNDDKKGEKV